MRLTKGKAYKVAWRDIINNNQWMTEEEIRAEVEDTRPQQHVWYFVAYQEDWRIFSSGKANEQGDFPDYYAIPKGCIEKLIQIK